MTKAEVYARLALMYKMSPNEIRLLTPYQQICLCSPEATSDVIHFDTYEEYLEWMAKR